jgi:preprotein translocase subunit SecG
MDIAIGIILIVCAVFLVVAVLLQHGKNHNLSGTIAGGAETFFGKSKASTIDKKLSTLTTVVSIVFVVLVLVSYLMQDTVDLSKAGQTIIPADAVVSDTTAETEPAAEEATDAAEETEAEDVNG